MRDSQEELEARIVQSHGAARARVVAGSGSTAALAALACRAGMPLAVQADGDTRELGAQLPHGAFRVVSEPSVEAFAEADAALRREGGLEAASGPVLWAARAIGGRDVRVPDLRALARAAHEHGALLAVDTSDVSAFGCRPLALGADLCIEMLSVRGDHLVAIAGDADVLSTVSPEAPSPDAVTCADALRALEDAPTCWQRRFDAARAIAEYLSCCDAVPAVRYPGLPGHPDHDVAATVLQHGFGPLVAFEVPRGATAAAFLQRCHLDVSASYAGGTRLSARSGEARYIRLVAGLDDPLAIADDLDQAMRWFCNPPEP